MSPRTYSWFLLLVAGLGGFLYGYDVGVIGAALPYIEKTIDLSLGETSTIAAAVLGGGMISSLVAGALCDWIGRKRVMLLAALMFLASVWLIVLARGFVPLFLGRAIQGLSGGIVAVAIPLYLAECLPAAIRGRGTAGFQLLLTLGILVSVAVGAHYTAAAGNDATPAAQDAAWRAMFRSAFLPGALFFAGALFLVESPRWLFRRGKTDAARAALLRSRPATEAELELREMADTQRGATTGGTAATGTLLQRRYVVPFLLTCAVLGLTQATGINSILQFVVVILKHAGFDATTAASQATLVTATNVVFTVVGLLLVDRLGRTALLKLGTAGIAVALLAGAWAFHRAESATHDVTAAVRARVAAGATRLDVDAAAFALPSGNAANQLTVLYATGGEQKLISAFSTDAAPFVSLPAATAKQPTEIARARLGPVPGRPTAFVVLGCLMLFIASFAVGPGVCVWLALSELMPTRIRSLGMGVGLLINQGVSTAIAAVFLPLAGHHGYAAIFVFWAACTVVFFLVAAFLLPETKGKTLEEIEAGFARKRAD